RSCSPARGRRKRRIRPPTARTLHRLPPISDSLLSPPPIVTNYCCHIKPQTGSARGRCVLRAVRSTCSPTCLTGPPPRTCPTSPPFSADRLVAFRRWGVSRRVRLGQRVVQVAGRGVPSAECRCLPRPSRSRHGIRCRAYRVERRGKPLLGAAVGPRRHGSTR